MTKSTKGSAHTAPKGTRGTFTEAVTADAGDEIIIAADASLRIFEVKWTPESYDEDAVITDDGTAITTAYTVDFKDASVFSENNSGRDWTITSPQTIQKVTYVASSADGSIVFNSASGRVKLGGAAKVDENGIPEEGAYRYVSFKIAGPGTVTFKAVSSTGGTNGEGRHFMVVLATYANDQLLRTKILSQNEVVTSSSAAVDETAVITAEDLEGANQPAVIYMYSDNKGINIHGLGFTPATE